MTDHHSSSDSLNTGDTRVDVESLPRTAVQDTAVNPFAECTNEIPYSGEASSLDGIGTSYGNAFRELDVDVSDRLAVWVAGHWLVGTVERVSTPGSTYSSYKTFKVVVRCDSTHRDTHDDLRNDLLVLTTSTDPAYRHGPGGWKTVDASVSSPRHDSGVDEPGDESDRAGASRFVLLGVCGTIVKLPRDAPVVECATPL